MQLERKYLIWLSILLPLWLAIFLLASVAFIGVFDVNMNFAGIPEFLWVNRSIEGVLPAMQNSAFIGLVVCIMIFVLGNQKQVKLHGDSSWSSKGDLKKSGLLAKSGLMLGKYQGAIIRLGGQEHVFIEAPTRAGKGVGVVIPNLLEWKGSAVVLDVKNENFEKTGGYRARILSQQVLLFDPMNNDGKTCRYNPLAYIERTNPIEVITELQRVGQMLYPEPKDGESFWLDSARSAFIGIGAYIAHHDGANDRKKLPFTIGEIYRQITLPDSQKHFHNIIKDRGGAAKGLSVQCVNAISDFVSSSANTYASIRQTLTSRINIWNNPYLDQATAKSDFEVKELRERPITLYLGASADVIEVIAPLYNLLFQQILGINMRELPVKGKSDVPVLLLMDEFARLGHAKSLADAFSLCAGFGFRLMPIVQDRAQLRGTYGPDKAREIISNCGAELIFGVKQQDLAEEIERRLGTFTYRAKSKSRKTWESFGGSVSTSDQRRSLMNPREIIEMDSNNMLLFRAATPPVKAKKLKYYEIKEYQQRSEIAPPKIAPIALPQADTTPATNALEVLPDYSSDADIRAWLTDNHMSITLPEHNDNAAIDKWLTEYCMTRPAVMRKEEMV